MGSEMCIRDSHRLIHEGIHTGGAGAEGARPPCVEAARSAASFMDECVAVAVAEAVAVAATEAMAEADQSIHDQSIQDPSIRAGLPSGPKWSQVVPSGPMGSHGGPMGSHGPLTPIQLCCGYEVNAYKT